MALRAAGRCGRARPGDAYIQKSAVHCPWPKSSSTRLGASFLTAGVSSSISGCRPSRCATSIVQVVDVTARKYSWSLSVTGVVARPGASSWKCTNFLTRHEKWSSNSSTRGRDRLASSIAADRVQTTVTGLPLTATVVVEVEERAANGMLNGMFIDSMTDDRCRGRGPRLPARKVAQRVEVQVLGVILVGQPWRPQPHQVHHRSATTAGHLAHFGPGHRSGGPFVSARARCAEADGSAPGAAHG